MNSINQLALKTLQFNKLCRISSMMLLQSRNCGYIRDWKPGPYPKTKEEREAAAKKYNLIPEDYEPYPDGHGTGDYPILPKVSQDARDYYEDFDCHRQRHNFGEPMHYDYDAYLAEKHNPNETFKVSRFKMTMSFLAMMTVMTMGYWLCEFFDIRYVYPSKPKHFPFVKIDGHEIDYTFENAKNLTKHS